MNRPSRFLKLAVVAAVFVTVFLAFITTRPFPEPSPPLYKSLHAAAVFDAQQIKGLVEAGADLNGRDENGHTPLWNAAQLNRPEGVRQLLSLGADPDDGGSGGDAPLIVAAFMGSDEVDQQMIRLLIKAGADVNVVGRQYHKTPLHYAAQAGNRDTVQLLIEAGADVDAESSEGDTPLQSAVVFGHVEICDLLLRAGANPELRNAVGFRPIDQLNVCPPSNGKRVQEVFRAHGADDQMRHELLAAARAAQDE